MPVDYQRHPPQAQLMQVFGCMLLIAVPALADWTDGYRPGEELLEQGRTASAIRELQSALAERPDHPAILDALGRAEFRAGHYQSARKYSDQALRVAGKDRAAVLSNSAMTSIVLGDKRRAESLAGQALELEPQNITILKVLAQNARVARANSFFGFSIANALVFVCLVDNTLDGMRPLIGNPHGTPCRRNQ